MFWSDLGPDIGFEGIGLVDPTLETVAVFAKPSNVQRTTSNLDEPPAHYKAEPKSEETSKESTPEEKPKESKEEAKPKLKTEEVKHEHRKPEIADHKWPAFEEDNTTPDFGKGVIFYMKNNKVVGILLWNIFNRIGLARTIIKQDKTYDDLNEVAKLFAIHS